MSPNSSKPISNGGPQQSANATNANNANGDPKRQQHQQECCSAAAFAAQSNGQAANGHWANQNHNHHNNNNNNNNNNSNGNNGNGNNNGGRSNYHGYNNNNNNNNGGGHWQPRAVVSLNPRQVDRLRSVLDQEVQIHGRENFPTLEIPLHTLIVNMRRKLREAGLDLKHVKLNGGAASYVFAQTESFPYSDVDLIFPIGLEDDGDFERVRQAVFAALLEMMPSSANKMAISGETLRDVYIRKMVKVTDGDRWSLFSLHNDYGRCIELKFVQQMRRAFEFSVDSFQITLDPLIDQPNEHRPIVRAESMYGDFMQALSHLNKRLIDTRNPEEIRGGGLLKYCHLLTRGFSATPNCRDMEKYMCSRFFIDFPDINVQEMKLLNYLQNHFGNEDELKLDYLHKLWIVIRDSTVCLMFHERRQTLSMVDRLRQQLSYNLMLYYQQFEPPQSAQQQQHQQQQQQYYNNRPRRYNGGNRQHWPNARNNGYRNNFHYAGPMLCVSPVSTIASSSIEEERQQQQQLQLASSPEPEQQQQNGQEAPTAVAKEPVVANAKDEPQQPQKQLPVVTILQPPNKQPAATQQKVAIASASKGQEPQQTASAHSAAQPQQKQGGGHIPRQTLLYLPPNASHWIPVV